MRAKSASRYDNLVEKALDRDATATRAEPKRSAVLKARQATAQVAAGKSRNVRVLEVAPDRVRLWPGHNRDYGALSIERCADLIDGFTRIGQQFPAIVRTIPDDPDHDWELVCGARRHWTASHLGRDLHVEIRGLNDREAFLLQDVENREREDVSDHERAVDYRRALPLYFEGNQARMADHLKIDRGNFNRLLQLADLPDEIVRAYGDRRDLLVHHGTFYTRSLSEPASRKRLLNAAVALHGQSLAGRDVMRQLRTAIAPAKKRTEADRAGQRQVIGGLSWALGAKGDVCELSFEIPTATDPAALARLRSEFEVLLRRIATDDVDESLERAP